jgi:hypothetical protein
MYCHDASSGLTDKKPYEATELGQTVRGEHTLGATQVPDSDINGGTGGWGNLLRGGQLQCYQCHSVHGANTIGFDKDHDGNLDPVALDGKVYTSNDGLENWDTKILRVDPSGDGVPLAKNQGGLIPSQLEGLSANPAAVRTAFCADCHNLNPNWEVTTDDTTRANNRSHPQGPGVDGLMEVYGETTRGVAGHLGPKQGCRGCHTASDNSGIVGVSRFPHQSSGWKLLKDNYDTTGASNDPSYLAGDPQRVAPNMDQICLLCHPINNIEDYGGYAEVEEVLCFRCHSLSGSYTSAPNVLTEFSKDSRHPTESYTNRHSESEKGNASAMGVTNRHAECLDCHNQEREIQGGGNPIRGVWGISVTNGAAGTVPTYTVANNVAFQYELCFKCHSSWTTRPNSSMYTTTQSVPLVQGDKALEFNYNNNAFHPVEAPGRNQSSNLNQQLQAAGLSTSSTIKCTDCHNSDGTADASGSASNSSFKPKGPHGAVNNSSLATPNNLVLRAFYYTDIAGPTSWDPNNFKLCFLCHQSSRLLSYSSSVFRTSFSDQSFSENLHARHLIDGNAAGYGVTCRNCHYNVHSNQQASNTQYVYFKNGSWHISNDSPPNGIKTHLVNFSPDVLPLNDIDPWSGFFMEKPQWSIWIDTDTAKGVSSGTRYCQVECHGLVMGWGLSPWKYKLDPARDDSLTY